MADNYLEKRYEEVFSGNGGKSTSGKRSSSASKKVHQASLDSLLLRNRSYRGYDMSYVVTEEQLREIASVCSRIPSGRNQQVLRFKLVVKGEESRKVVENIKLGGALPELHLPFPGTEPEAFIVICSTVEESRIVSIDLGIASQSMLLKAVDMGLNGIMIAAFNREGVKKALGLELTPIFILAIGKGAEKIQLLSIHEGEGHNYFREGGIHYVPKVAADELILK